MVKNLRGHIMILTYKIPNKYRHKLPIQLRILGINHLQEPIHREKGFSIFQWIYCVRGRGEFILDHNRTIINPGQGALIYPSVPYEYHGLTSNWTTDFICFDGKNCYELLSTLNMFESNVYHFINKDIFPKHVQNLYLLQERNIKNKTAEYSKECYNFLLNLSLCVKKIVPSILESDNVILQEIVNYLDNNYTQDITLDILAQHLGISKGYLCSFFKEHMHQTIMHYLLNTRMNRARIFLVQYPEKKVLEIAQMCGFEDASYFGKVFKREIGMTPENYRKGMY